jgi:hypothetical protein
MAISAQHNRFQFNEYVSPIASQDLINVALKKQEMYDEGRKQIKQVYDNYGQLRSTIINDDARNYLDQEFGKLIKNVQQNAGLDFANIGNVEAVVNLGKPFENDQYIKNALENGMEAKRRYAELDKVDKSQRNADNDLVYLNDIAEYQQRGGLDTKLQKNNTYESYVDIKKKLEEAEKAVEAETDYDMTTDGTPEGYLGLVEIKRKRADDIYQRAMANMTPDEQRQLQIHAQAQMLRLGSDAVYQTWVGHNKEQKMASEAVLKETKKQMLRLSALSPQQQTPEVREAIKRYQQIIESQQSVVDAANENIQMNPDDFDLGEYTGFFTKRFIDGFSKRMAFENRKLDLKEDVAWKLRTQHRNELSTIAAREASQKRVEQYKLDMSFIPQASTNTASLKGVTGLLTNPAAVTGKTDNVAKIGEIRNQITANTNIPAARKAQILNELNQLEAVYKSPSGVVTINRGTASSGSWSIDDFKRGDVLEWMESGNLIEAGNHPTYEQELQKTKGQIMGKINAYTGMTEAQKKAYEKVYPPKTSEGDNPKEGSKYDEEDKTKKK